MLGRVGVEVFAAHVVLWSSLVIVLVILGVALAKDLVEVFEPGHDLFHLDIIVILFILTLKVLLGPLGNFPGLLSCFFGYLALRDCSLFGMRNINLLLFAAVGQSAIFVLLYYLHFAKAKMPLNFL